MPSIEVDVESRIREILALPTPKAWIATGDTRSIYLDLMQVILAKAAEWQDENGAIIDPVEGFDISLSFVAAES